MPTSSFQQLKLSSKAQVLNIKLRYECGVTKLKLPGLVARKNKIGSRQLAFNLLES